jgi:hypothetical protein
MGNLNYLKIVTAVFLSTSCSALAEPSLTIYNQNFAVVRDNLNLDLSKGINEVSVTDLAAHLEPDSVILRDPKGQHSIQILEQNYRADPVSEELLLSLYEGKEIDFLISDEKGNEKIVRGKIIRSGYTPLKLDTRQYWQEYIIRQVIKEKVSTGQPIIKVDNKLRFSLPGKPLFPSLADETILKPTVHWVLQTDKKGSLDAELSYITKGLNWKADYNMLAQEKGDTIQVIGWVTIDNQSGKTFNNARIKLLAGDVSKIQELERLGGYGMATPSRDGPSVSEKAFEDYHIYTLNRPTTIRDSETKQVEFLRADGVEAKRIYVYDGAKLELGRYQRYAMEHIRQNKDYGTQCNPKVWVMRELKNSKENNLGIPLPQGRMRFYRLDDDGQLEFTGENLIDHTPRDETVRVQTGNAFDLIGERKRLNYQIDTERNWLDESFEIKVRNRKENEAAEVRVVEHLYRWINWEIVEKSNDFLKTDSQTIEFHIDLLAGQEKVITYKVHYTW